MQIVAERLSTIALEDMDPLHLDRYGRSAFNRFYYATYHEARNLLGELNAAWARTSHKGIPNLLREAIRKQYLAEIRRQSGTLLSTHQAKTMSGDLRAETEGLARLLETSYAVRCVADYEQSAKVTRAGSILELQKHTIDEARSWPRRASRHTKLIRSIWTTLGRP